jgi:dihydrodipicolinate synthase/N-acetylneuraminate lyase
LIVGDTLSFSTIALGFRIPISMTTHTPELTGVYPILYTPFDEDGRVDFRDLAAEVEYLVAAGVDGVGVAVGSEVFKLTEAERDSVLKAVVGEVRGRVPVVMHAGAPGTDVAVGYARQAAELGADALMVTPPLFLPVPPDVIVEHYRRIAEAGGLPVFIQDIWTSPIAPALAVRIAREVPLARYAKAETPPTPDRAAELKALGGDDVTVFGGFGGVNFVPELRRGSVGTMPGPAVPEAFVTAWTLWQVGDEAGAEAVMEQVTPLLGLLMRSLDGSYHLTKEILRRRGVIRSTGVRMPTSRPDETAYRELARLMERLNFAS